MSNIKNALPQGTELRGERNKYYIQRTLGQGTFGITYLATTRVALSGALGNMDVTVNVAIKEFFMAEINDRAADGSSVENTGHSLVQIYRKKFYREAENLARLKHPNIVKVLEVFDENDTTYYAMEYVEGESLDDYIKRKGRIPEKEVLSQLQEIGSALKYMHDHKMLHLDLKPKNIMRNREGHLLLIDFGLSKQYDQNGEPESSTTIGLGTPGYAPIEQANYQRDGQFPATLDIYALGATLYKMLTGTIPPHASDILGEGFPDDMFVKLGISQTTTDMVRKAMNPMKKHRHQSISELLGDTGNSPIDSIINRGGGGESDKELEEEHSYSRQTIEEYGISIISIVSDKEVLIYYRGRTYTGDTINVDLSDITSSFDELKSHVFVKDDSRINFETFFKNNKDALVRGFNVITYCSESDLLRIVQRKLGMDSTMSGKYRIVQEMQLIPLCFGSSVPEYIDYRFVYQHLYCDVGFGGDMVEILQSGFIENMENSESEKGMKKLSNYEGFAYLVLGAYVMHQILRKNFLDLLFLAAFPFDIKAEIWIDGRYRDGLCLIRQGTSVPCKKSELKLISDDRYNIIISFLGKRFCLDVYELFRYYPYSIELYTEIDAGAEVCFSLKDKESKKEIPISQTQLLNYEVNNEFEETVC